MCLFASVGKGHSLCVPLCPCGKSFINRSRSRFSVEPTTLVFCYLMVPSWFNSFAGALASWTKSTRKRAFSTGVCCSTPWPRLKMWPGRLAAASSTSVARAAIVLRSTSRVIGSRLPCTARSCPTRVPAVGQVDAPVDTNHIATGLCLQRQKRGVACAEMYQRSPGRQAGDDFSHVRHDISAGSRFAPSNQPSYQTTEPPAPLRRFGH